MIYFFLGMLREPLRIVVSLIGLIAIATYLSGGDMNEAVGGFISALKPLKDQVVHALTIVIPAVMEEISNTVTGIAE